MKALSMKTLQLNYLRYMRNSLTIKLCKDTVRLPETRYFFEVALLFKMLEFCVLYSMCIVILYFQSEVIMACGVIAYA